MRQVWSLQGHFREGVGLSALLGDFVAAFGVLW